ncbi:MAG: hypothetical protein RL341_2532 [Pseudomonadota bacterium]|jgi:prevent-host-death family protein
MQINVLDAKTRLSQLIKAAQDGEEVIIANRGQPVVKLVRIAHVPRQTGARTAGKSGLLNWLAAHPMPAHVKRTPEQIAADLQAERDAWD